jgi:hypothetical protein
LRRAWNALHLLHVTQPHVLTTHRTLELHLDLPLVVQSASRQAA